MSGNAIDMGFVSRANFLIRVPTARAYLHDAGIEVYGGETESAMISAAEYFRGVLDDARERCDKYNFVLAALWADNGEKVADFFGLYDIHPEKWPGNPDVDTWVVRNGVWRRENPTTCGDALIVLGEEERFRRESKNLEAYSRGWPIWESAPEHKLVFRT